MYWLRDEENVYSGVGLFSFYFHMIEKYGRVLQALKFISYK
jgi:hypothetical protein